MAIAAAGILQGVRDSEPLLSESGGCRERRLNDIRFLDSLHRSCCMSSRSSPPHWWPDLFSQHRLTDRPACAGTGSRSARSRGRDPVPRSNARCSFSSRARTELSGCGRSGCGTFRSRHTGPGSEPVFGAVGRTIHSDGDLVGTWHRSAAIPRELADSPLAPQGTADLALLANVVALLDGQPWQGHGGAPGRRCRRRVLRPGVAGLQRAGNGLEAKLITIRRP